MKDNDLIACRTRSASPTGNHRARHKSYPIVCERLARLPVFHVETQARGCQSSSNGVSEDETMKTANWICWLLVVCVCLVEARYKIRRPPLPPPPPPPKLMFKKSWPIAHRISMGNTIHIGGNFPPKRLPHKPPNYRIRRPPMINVVPAGWKNQIPLRASLGNHAVLPQRPPVKEFHSMSKVTEYSPEYRPETAILPATHRGGVDDDKGAIHTIPAPNLSPMDRPYNTEIGSEEAHHQRQYITENNYKPNHHGSLVPNFDLATIGTSLPPQRPVTSSTPTQHQYEVTETNDVNQKEYNTVPPTFFPPDFDVTRLTTSVNPDLQTNEVLHHPAPNIGLIGTNIQFGQANTPMQTNLHSSLHVGFPGTAGQTPYTINQQIPDLHVGHPAPAGPPLSATQLYDLLNSLPQKVTEQYLTGPQPQLQQHILQQQLGQFFQPGGVTGFSQPQMHSFNYDEQDNKEQQQQQQILLGQDYVAGRINSDYSVVAEPSADSQDNENLQQNEELAYLNDGTEQLENNIEYEETNNQKGQTTFFNKVTNDGGVSTQFYTTLPNREAAEKLAALAAAGNVNSHLIGQLRKQQQENAQKDDTMPANHKDDGYEANQQTEEESRYDSHQGQKYQDGQYQTQDRQQYGQQEHEQQLQYEEQQKQYDRQQTRQQYRPQSTRGHSSKRPLRIMVPDESEYTSNVDQYGNGEKESTEVEYEYENDDPDASNSQAVSSFDGRTTYDQQPTAEFGTRLSSKTGK